MVGVKIERRLDKDRDVNAQRALHRLRTCCLLVLYVVRLEREVRGHFPEILKDAEPELGHFSNDVRDRVYKLVKAAQRNPVEARIAKHLRDFIASMTLSRLCPDDFHSTAESLLNDYVELREDFFAGPAFKEWRNDRPWYMYCYGEPRCGKSSFAAAVARRLQTQYSHDSNTAVVTLFLGHADDMERYTSISGVLGALLKELIASKAGRTAKPNVLHALKATDRKALPYSLGLLRRCILEEMAPLKRVFLIVDGLDAHLGYEESRTLEAELVGLRSFSADMSCALRLMLVQARTDLSGTKVTEEVWCDATNSSGTSCGEACKDLYWTCEQCLGGFIMCYSCFMNHQHCGDSSHMLKVNVELRSEVVKYVDTKLDNLSTTRRIGQCIINAPAILDHIRIDVINKSGGVLVVAKLYLDTLIEQQSLEEVLDLLDRIPVYQRLYYSSLIFEIMSQRKEDSTFAMAALAIVAVTCNDTGRAMYFAEMKQAVAQLTGHNVTRFTESHLLKCTRGLLAIPDVVVPFHDSASTYLAEECEEVLSHRPVDLGCLCIQAISSFSRDPSLGHIQDHQALMQHLNQNPFVAYALRHWGTNLRRAPTKEAEEACIELLQSVYIQQPRLRQAMFLAINDSRASVLWQGGTLAHAIAWFGLVNILKHFHNQRGELVDINSQDSAGRTPLYLACLNMDRDMTSTLLSLGADSLIADQEDRTVLWEAVERDEVAVFALLLQHADQNAMAATALNARNSFHEGETLLMLAIQKSSDSAARDLIVAMLAERQDLDLSIQDYAGRTVLHVAAGAGYFHGLRLLMRSNRPKCEILAALCIRDQAGRTAAMTALTNLSGFDTDDSVDQFLAFLADSPNQTFLHAVDNNGRSLLHWAVTDEDYAPIASYLIEAEADVNKRDVHGRTPLHVAAATLDVADEPGIVRLLLKARVDLMAEDEQGLRPYEVAAQRDASWAHLLFANDPASRKSPGISWSDAVYDPDTFDPDRFFQMITRLPDSALSETDPLCYNLLHCAVEASHGPAIEYLLSNQNIDANARNQIYDTALHMALGNLDLVELLLAHDRTDVNVLDLQGRSSLQRAFDQDDVDLQFAVAIALVERGANLIISQATKQAILSYAIAHSGTSAYSAKAVQILLKNGTSLFGYCKSGQLPSETAREAGASKEMIELVTELENDVIARAAG